MPRPISVLCRRAFVRRSTTQCQEAPNSTPLDMHTFHSPLDFARCSHPAHRSWLPQFEKNTSHDSSPHIYTSGGKCGSHIMIAIHWHREPQLISGRITGTIARYFGDSWSLFCRKTASNSARKRMAMQLATVARPHRFRDHVGFSFLSVDFSGRHRRRSVALRRSCEISCARVSKVLTTRRMLCEIYLTTPMHDTS